MPKLYMLLLGCKPPGRHIEQHDVFFGIAESVKELVPQLLKFWPEAKGKLHVDGWREVTHVDGFQIEVLNTKADADRVVGTPPENQLFFINLGGYQPDIFDEPHFKILTVQKDMGAAIQHAKRTDFFKRINFEGANSHVDDKYGVDVDDIFEVGDILAAEEKSQYQLMITRSDDHVRDQIHLGYFKLDKLP